MVDPIFYLQREEVWGQHQPTTFRVWLGKKLLKKWDTMTIFILKFPLFFQFMDVWGNFSADKKSGDFEKNCLLFSILNFHSLIFFLNRFPSCRWLRIGLGSVRPMSMSTSQAKEIENSELLYALPVRALLRICIRNNLVFQFLFCYQLVINHIITRFYVKPTVNFQKNHDIVNVVTKFRKFEYI